MPILPERTVVHKENLITLPIMSSFLVVLNTHKLHISLLIFLGRLLCYTVSLMRSAPSSSPKLVEEMNVEDVVQLCRDHAVSEGV